jgi:hypothetical membrane protein
MERQRILSVVFSIVIAGCLVFVALTLAAMLLYPGGTLTDKSTPGYSFFQNFFSDLGRTESYAGRPSPIPAVIFFIALTMAGNSLVFFFAAFPWFFTRTLPGRMFSLAGSILGILSGLCFIGIAFAPANLALTVHKQLVLWAFRLFPAAVFLYAVAILREPDYPKRFALVFIAFGVLLVLYILLLEFGPDARTPDGMVIQATGQKIIVYASILSILIQAFGARQAHRIRSQA